MSDTIICPVQHVTCHRPDCTLDKCGERQAAADAMLARVMQSIETKLNGDQQARVIECGMRMRELACYYGPYFQWALSLTSAEISAGALLMPKQAEFERPESLMLPGGRRADEPVEIVVPGITKH